MDTNISKESKQSKHSWGEEKKTFYYFVKKKTFYYFVELLSKNGFFFCLCVCDNIYWWSSELEKYEEEKKS